MRPAAFNAFDPFTVEWGCCGHHWEIIVAPHFLERLFFQPHCETCGKDLLPADMQRKAQWFSSLPREEQQRLMK